MGEDGATHHGCYDMSMYRSIPGAVIAAPKDELELKNMMYSAMLAQTGPYIIRYPRGCGEGAQWKEAEYQKLETGRGELILEGTRVAVLSAGPFVYRAVEAAERMKAELGWNPTIYNIRYIKPLDAQLVKDACSRHDRLVTIEDGTLVGGLYGAVSEFVSAMESPIPVKGIGIPDRYISQGTQTELRQECGLTTDEIFRVFNEEC